MLRCFRSCLRAIRGVVGIEVREDTSLVEVIISDFRIFSSFDVSYIDRNVSTRRFD